MCEYQKLAEEASFGFFSNDFVPELDFKRLRTVSVKSMSLSLKIKTPVCRSSPSLLDSSVMENVSRCHVA